jgi:hypothetical protein
VAVGQRDAGPIDAEFARLFCGADFFGTLQAYGINEGVGHIGERDGAPEGDASLTSEFHKPGDKGADLVDFGDFG